MIKRILVALSGTPFTESAIRHALELAKIHSAEVTGVTDVDLARLAQTGPVPIGGGAAAASLVEHRLQLTQEHIDEAIAQFEKACGEAGQAQCCVDREEGDPFEQLAEQWRYHDFTVAGLRGLFEYGVVHNPDDELIRLLARGVRPILAVAREFRPIKRVLIAYGGSMESAKAMKRFVQMQLWPEVQVRIACFERKDDEAEGLLADAATYCRAHDIEPETDRVTGDARHHLLDYATEWSADLIVMGASSRARIFKHLLGDTAIHCLRQAEIPLFLAQ